MKNIACIILLFFSLNLNSYEGDDDKSRFQILTKCNTVDPINFNEAKTKITFYGDSRMDFVNAGSWYGNNTMAKILNEPYNGVPYSSGDLFSDDKKGY
jgi:hypothetical protein